MTKDKVEELIESFDTLIEWGVIFHYGSEEIEQGEITKIVYLHSKYDSYFLPLSDFL